MIAALGVLAGLILGSFIAVLTLRWPAGGSIVSPRSHCDTCTTPLTAQDLVPVLSFLVLRGHCRHCAAAVPPRHLWIELAAGAITGLALGLHPNLIGLAGAGFGLALLTLAILDVEHFWLPDRITLPLLAAGLIAAPPSLPDRLIGVATGYLVLAAIGFSYRRLTGRQGIGGGDPKLLAAIGAWLGWQFLPIVLMLAAGLGLVLAVMDKARGRGVTRHTRMPLGALLAVAAFPLWLALAGGLSLAALMAITAA